MEALTAATTARAAAGEHSVSRAVAAAEEALASLLDGPVWGLGSAEARDALLAMARLASRAAELEGRLLVHAEALGAHAHTDAAGDAGPGATSTAAWLAHATRATRRDAGGRARLAALLEARTATREALGRGEIRAEQAVTICHALSELEIELRHDAQADGHGEEQADEWLPVDPEVVGLAEKHLLELAEHHDAQALRILGRRILEVADPARAEAHEARALAREEARAAARTRFTMSEDGHGLTHGRFTIPTATAAALAAALHAIAAPKHHRATHGAGSYDHTRPGPARLGAAFCEYISGYPAQALPSSGKTNATVVVTIPLTTLLGGLAAAHLDTGHRLTAGAARMMACQAGLIPAVLDGHGRVLDLGRSQRLFTTAQRLARITERTAAGDPTCEHPTCQTPAASCHAHHTTGWARGGRTDRRDLRLLCPRHHRDAHAPTPRARSAPLRR